MARPTKLTPTLQALICARLEQGEFRRSAAALAGIDEATLQRWYHRGATEPKSVFGWFRAAVDAAEEKARATFEAQLLQVRSQAEARESAAHAHPHSNFTVDKLVLGRLAFRPSERTAGSSPVEQLANAVLVSYERGAWERGYSWVITDTQALSKMAQPCHYCGAPPDKVRERVGGVFRYSGLDRVDNAVGYTDANTVPCCSGCNRAKGVESYEGFLARVQRIAERHLGRAA